MASAQFVTGATGFIGGALVLELLRRTDDRILCGVRCDDDRERGQRRLEASLREAARLYGEEELMAEVRGRCWAVPMDITVPADTFLLPPGVGRVSAFWHSAASLRFEARFRKSIFRDNLEGSRNSLRAARILGAERFLYFSTAYVAGQRVGHIEETLPDPSTVPSNCYEESKIAAEQAVLAETAMETRILRPSIVIGHSRHHGATSFTGIYGFIREVKQFQRKVEERLGAILSHRPLSLVADPLSLLNVIPVDAVAADAVAVGLADSDARIFHLTNDTPTPVGAAIQALFDEIGFARCRFVTSQDRFSTLDEVLHRELTFYNSYMISPKTFCRANTDALAGRGRACTDVQGEAFMSYIRWYLRHLEEGRAVTPAAAAGETSGEVNRTDFAGAAGGALGARS